MGVSLREVFTPLFAYILFFIRDPAHRQRPFADIRREVERLLEEQRILVKRYDIAVQDYENARFAQVAWIDEQLLKYTQDANSVLHDQWKHAPLQEKLYSTRNAGEEFYERFERLGAGQDQVREIYHLCLCLGFRGRHYDARDFTMIQLRRAHAQHTPTPILDLLDLEKKKERITPQPYDVQPLPLQSRPQPRSRLWAVVPLLGLVAGVLYFFWPAPPPSPPSPSPPPSLRLIDIEEAVEPFTCCRITVVDAHNGVVNLEGYVESEEQRQQVQEAVLRVPQVTNVRDTFRIIPQPFCEVIELLEPFRDWNKESGLNLSIQPNKQCESTYYNGEDLVIEVAAREPLQYIYIDYYVADRSMMAHVLPSLRQPDNSLNGARSITVGGQNSKNRWRIQPPFGMELVTVISSAQPLFAQPRLAPERVTTYLEEVRRALPPEATNSQVAASYCFITTADHK